MRTLITAFICFLSVALSAQVTSVDYFMKYNCETNQYDVHIVILEGTANTIPQRAQFNSQVSVVVPTGEAVVLTESYMPLKNNQAYDSEEPINWNLGTPHVAPAEQPESDFHGITPTLAPAAFYNDLTAGDVVKIFSFTVGNSGQYDERVRFFKNGTDPAPLSGAYFTNGFTLGGATQLYNSSSEEFCVTSTENTIQPEINAYPNPFQDQISIEIPEGTKEVVILDTKGGLFYKASTANTGNLRVNTSDFPSGVYFVRLKTSDNFFTTKRIMKL